MEPASAGQWGALGAGLQWKLASCHMDTMPPSPEGTFALPPKCRAFFLPSPALGELGSPCRPLLCLRETLRGHTSSLRRAIPAPPGYMLPCEWEGMGRRCLSPYLKLNALKLFKDQWARKRDQGSASLMLLLRGVFTHFMHWLFHVTALQKSLEQDRHNGPLPAGATVTAR